MIKNKRMMAFVMAAVVGMTTIQMPIGTVNAAEVSETVGKETTQEYVVFARNNSQYEQVEAEYGTMTDENFLESDMLEENYIAVVKLTDNEAEELENREDILLVEEDIVLTASEMKYDKELTKMKQDQQKKKKLKKKKQKIMGKLEDEMIQNLESEYEWNLKAINADEVLENMRNEQQEKIKVAVLDSGVDYVSGINLAGYVNFVDEEEISPIFQDMTGHGTGIASIIAGNGKTGIYGVNPNVELYSVKIMDEENMASLSRVIKGIYWCIENDIDIINMSFGTTVCSQALKQAVADAHEEGILLVAAAGNESSEVEYPAAFPEVMAVAATSPNAEISDFSNRGEELEIAALGEKIQVASFFDGNVVTHGTSIAVPHVVGVASLLWEKDTEKSNEFIRQLIDYSAKEIEGINECGLLDAEYALDVYDLFAEMFDGSEAILKDNIVENERELERFEEINEDETYVEGRWMMATHADMLGGSVSGFSTSELNLIKKGCMFPDKYEPWKGAAATPRWHGKWRRTSGCLTNYVAICEMITETAINGGSVQPFWMYSDFGLDSVSYNLLKSDIENLNFKNVLNSYGYSNTKTNRKYFLYGCGIHTITDAFAHSVAEPVNGEYVRIPHKEGNSADADTISLYRERYNIACNVASYALVSLKNDSYTDGKEVNKAVKKELDGKTPKFRIMDIKRNVESNVGEVYAAVKKVNIESSQTKLTDGKVAN